MSHRDLIQPFKIERSGLRGRFVRLGPALESVLVPHDYPSPVAELMGEALALAAVLAASLRFEGVFRFQAQGDGPLGLMMADVTSEGDLRGYARFDRQGVAEAGDVAAAPVPKLMGSGRMTVAVDQAGGDRRFQGITALDGRRLADCAESYFRQSEPLETIILLAARPGGETPAGAAALMIQRETPDGESQDMAALDDAEEDWRRAGVLAASLSAGEMLDSDLAPGDLLFRLFNEDGLRLYRERSLRARCRCSRDKVAATLARFPRAELDGMMEDGRITVTCEFCKTAYVFEGRDLDSLGG